MTKTHGKRLQEAGYINKSLYALGQVISVLSSKKGRRHLHVPYRDCKLTMLLKNSLGGSSKTIMFACLAPTASVTMDSIQTLSFAMGYVKIFKNLFF